LCCCHVASCCRISKPITTVIVKFISITNFKAHLFIFRHNSFASFLCLFIAVLWLVFINFLLLFPGCVFFVVPFEVVTMAEETIFTWLGCLATCYPFIL